MKIKQRTDTRKAMALISPALLFLFLVQIYPIFDAFYLSLLKIKGRNSTFVGLTNYIHIFQNSDFWESSWLTALFTFGYLSLTLILAMLLALLLNRKLKFSSLYLILIFIPWILSPVVAGTMWRWLFQPAYGIIQTLFEPLIHKSLITDKAGAMMIIILAFLWQNLPLTTLLFLGGLQTISKEIFECASLDGVSGVQKFRFITLPLIKPILLINMIMGTIRGINVISIVMSITRGGPGRATGVWGLYLYQTAWQFGDFGSGAALGIIMFFVSVLLSLLYIRSVKLEPK